MASRRFAGSDSSPRARELLVRDRVEVLGVRLACVESVLDPVEPGGEHGGRREVRIARAVDRAVLDPARPRDAEHLRAVVVAVRDPDGRPRRAARRRAELQPLVRVDGRRGHAAVRARVRPQPADEAVRRVGEPEPARIGLVEEQVRVAVPERHVEVAAVPGQVRERLRHERRDHPVLLRERVNHVAEEDRAVARDERVVVGEVLLELAVRVLVVVRVVAPAELVAELGTRW